MTQNARTNTDEANTQSRSDQWSERLLDAILSLHILLASFLASIAAGFPAQKHSFYTVKLNLHL